MLTLLQLLGTDIIIHFCIFTGVSLVVASVASYMRPYSNVLFRITFANLTLCLVGVIEEYRRFFDSTQTAQWLNAASDILGTAIGSLPFILAYGIWRLFRRHEKPTINGKAVILSGFLVTGILFAGLPFISKGHNATHTHVNAQQLSHLLKKEKQKKIADSTTGGTSGSGNQSLTDIKQIMKIAKQNDLRLKNRGANTPSGKTSSNDANQPSKGAANSSGQTSGNGVNQPSGAANSSSPDRSGGANPLGSSSISNNSTPPSAAKTSEASGTSTDTKSAHSGQISNAKSGGSNTAPSSGSNTHSQSMAASTATSESAQTIINQHMPAFNDLKNSTQANLMTIYNQALNDYNSKKKSENVITLYLLFQKYKNKAVALENQTDKKFQKLYTSLQNDLKSHGYSPTQAQSVKTQFEQEKAAIKQKLLQNVISGYLTSK